MGDPGRPGLPAQSGSGPSSISSRTKEVLTSIVDKFDHPGLPPALILNLVNLESLEEMWIRETQHRTHMRIVSGTSTRRTEQNKTPSPPSPLPWVVGKGWSSSTPPTV